MRVVVCLASALLLCALFSEDARGDLMAGDINIIGWRADAPDTIAFVTWVDITAGTSIDFTDLAYQGGGDGSGDGPGGGFYGTDMESRDGFLTWTATEFLGAGTVVVMETIPGVPGMSVQVDEGTATGDLLDSGFLGLGLDSDSIFAGQGGDFQNPTYNGTILYGLEYAGLEGWANGGQQASILPSNLDFVGGNIAPAHVDNGQYTGPRTGLTVAEYKLAIHDLSNWTLVNTPITAHGTVSSVDFEINSVPEPSSLAMMGLGVVGLVGYRWRRRKGNAVN